MLDNFMKLLYNVIMKREKIIFIYHKPHTLLIVNKYAISHIRGSYMQMRPKKEERWKS